MADNNLNVDAYTLLGQIFKPDMVNILRQKLTGESTPAVIADMVRPGDLITADLINNIVNKLNSLESRLTTLEALNQSGYDVQISVLIPSGPVAVGSEVVIVGKNFGLVGSSTVTIDNVLVQELKAGSDDTMLVFDVPLIAGVPQSGKSVLLQVTGQHGSKVVPLTVLPAVPTVPEGNVFVTLTKSPDGKLVAGKSYTFVFTVKAITNLDETYLLRSSVEAGWSTKIVDQNDLPAAQEITIPKGDPPAGSTVDVRVQVTIPPGTPAKTKTTLKLQVTSKRNPTDLQGQSSAEPLEVEGVAPSPHQIEIAFSNVLTPSGAGTATESNGVVLIPTVKKQYRIDFSAIFKEPGKYVARLKDPGSQWTVKISGAKQETPLQLDLEIIESSLNNLVKVMVTANETASGSLALIIEKVDDSTIFGTREETIQVAG